jgi:plastocyanin
MSPSKTWQTTLVGALVLPVLALALSGCTGSPPSPTLPSGSGSTGQPADSGASKVVALNLRFAPADITVTAGTTVRWVNGEAIGHTVTSGSWGDVNKSTGLRGTETADGMYDHSLSPKGQDGDTFEFTFTKPGTYKYFCKPHLTMYGTITVR